MYTYISVLFFLHNLENNMSRFEVRFLNIYYEIFLIIINYQKNDSLNNSKTVYLSKAPDFTLPCPFGITVIFLYWK